MSGLPLPKPKSLQQALYEAHQAEAAKQEAARKILAFSHEGLELKIDFSDPEKKYKNQVPDFLRDYRKKAVPVLKIFAEAVVSKRYDGGPVFFGAYLQGVFSFESHEEAISICESYENNVHVSAHAKIYKIKFLYLMGKKTEAFNLFRDLDPKVKTGFNAKWQGYLNQVGEEIAVELISSSVRSPVRTSLGTPIRSPGKRSRDGLSEHGLEEGEIREVPSTPKGAESPFSIHPSIHNASAPAPVSEPMAAPMAAPVMMDPVLAVPVGALNDDSHGNASRKVRVLSAEIQTQTEAPKINSAEAHTQTEDLRSSFNQDQSTQVSLPSLMADDLSLEAQETLSLQPEPQLAKPALSLAPISTAINYLATGPAMDLCVLRMAALRKLIDQTTDPEKLERYLLQLDLLHSPLGLSSSTMGSPMLSLLPSASRSPGVFFGPELPSVSRTPSARSAEPGAAASFLAPLTSAAPADLETVPGKFLSTRMAQIDTHLKSSSDRHQVEKLLPYLKQLDQEIHQDFDVIKVDWNPDLIQQLFKQVGQLETLIVFLLDQHVIKEGESVQAISLRRVNTEDLSHFFQISAKIFAEFYLICHELKIKNLESNPEQASLFLNWAEGHAQKVSLCTEALTKQGHGSQYLIDFNLWLHNFNKMRATHMPRDLALVSPDSSPARMRSHGLVRGRTQPFLNNHLGVVLSPQALNLPCAAGALGVGSIAGRSDDRSDLQSRDSSPAFGSQ